MRAVMSDSLYVWGSCDETFFNFPQHQKEKRKNNREGTRIINHFIANSADRESDLNFDIQFS